jgi:indole-3-glycerol phosphate synthase
MSGFLARVATASRERVQSALERESLAELRARADSTPAAPALALHPAFDVIAEYKRQSPALGPLVSGDDRLAPRVTAYSRGGAAAVSVLTEPAHFRGELAHLVAAAAILAPLGVPVIRKDFLVNPYQLYEARAAGAGGVLLIIRLLSDQQLGEMLDCARELGLFVLLEAFDAQDIARATTEVAAGVPERSSRISRSEGTLPPDPGRGARILLGVNCRDLETLEVLPHRFQDLAPLLPPGMPHVAESGISTPEQCASIARAGYGMALIGGALMRDANPLAAIRAMLVSGRTAARVAA